MSSVSARLLANALGIKRIRRQGDFVPNRGDVIINWGSGTSSQKATIVNDPYKVSLAVDKVSFFKMCKGALDGPRTPDWTTSRATAIQWALGGSDLVVRKLSSSSGGKGIEIFPSTGDPSKAREMPIAPLYTKYVKKMREYRVHIFKGEIIHLQMKLKKEGVPANQVQNSDNGYVYTSNTGAVTGDVKVQAQKAFKAMGLDFGAFDVIYNQSQDKAYVLEMNTAPGIEGISVEKYALAIRKHYII